MSDVDQMPLAVAIHEIDYGACCNPCRETRRIDLVKLMQRFGPDFLVGDIRPRLRCSKCGNRHVISVTLWKRATATERMSAHWK